ncbi:hypothetical protein COU80_02515 [Candidatus Peregrinibacteria bacterium CG10_big_fil_rev_8_21_14_0_10_55_24]|nr:MAG: hypothetical protein COU80_02515 [Candidatus Peregrinibacteria bacterium CG10_big_fil_rev_8_21_14_0_10_55_24]
MITKDLLSILQSVGLEEKQAALYLAGQQLLSAPASAYAKQTGLNRVTAYTVLEELVGRGLFTVMKKNRTKWYAPVAPEYLAVEARKNVDALQRSLPELRSLRGAEERKPVVRFFQGWDGVKHVYEHTLTARSELLNYANSAIVRSHWERYDEEYVAQRVERGIKLRGIAPDDVAGRMVHGEDKERLREIRLVPAKDFNFDNEINIYDSTVAIVTFGERAEDAFGVIIESREVAETQRQIFEMAWRYARMSRRRR